MRYDNLHGDEDEVELTSDEIYELECQMADQMNDDMWLTGDQGSIMKWEMIYYDAAGKSMHRCKVFKGWLIETRSDYDDYVTMVFVPDENHEWELKNE